MPTVVTHYSRTTLPLSCVLRVLGLSMLLWITGCSPDNTEEQLDDYHARLSRTLDTTLPALPSRASLSYPARNDLLLQPEGIEIDLTDLYNIQTCELGSLVAERNTALGKVQAYSVRLRYEYQLIEALEQCIAFYQQSGEDLENREGQLTTMQEWLKVKSADYALHWSNMLTLSDETKQAFGRPLPGLLNGDDLDITGQVASLKQLNQYGDGNALQDARLETHLQQLALLRLPASVWFAAQQLANGLPVITQQLDTLLPALTCGQGRPDDTATILRNVFYLSFIEKIQPIGSRINAFHYAFEPISLSWQQSPVLPPAFKMFLAEQSQQFAEYQLAMKNHVTVWQTFLARCNMSPGT